MFHIHACKYFSKIIGRLFDDNTGNTPENHEIESMRAVMLESNLKHLIINNSMINKIDSSINRFTKLISIDLSGNNITSITDMILLPKLQRINISNNKLTSLKALECLTSLKTLNASNNDIKSLTAVNILVPLGRSLLNIDLSNNPILAGGLIQGNELEREGSLSDCGN